MHMESFRLEEIFRIIEAVNTAKSCPLNHITKHDILKTTGPLTLSSDGDSDTSPDSLFQMFLIVAG